MFVVALPFSSLRFFLFLPSHHFLDTCKALCVSSAASFFFLPINTNWSNCSLLPPSGRPFVSPSLFSSYNPSHLLPPSLPLIETRSSHDSNTMSSDFKSLTVKKYPRLPGRKTSESRYWRKFKVRRRIHAQLLHSLLNQYHAT